MFFANHLTSFAIAGALVAFAGLGAPGTASAESAADADIPVPFVHHGAGQPRDEKDGAAFAKLLKAWKSNDGKRASVSTNRGNGNRQALTSSSNVGRQAQRSAGSSALTSSFGMRLHPIRGVKRPHLGVDLAAPTGAPVFATADGVVSIAGANGGYGLLIALEHEAGMETRYGHLSRLNVAGGQRVRKGEIIGFVGSTGLSTGPHLHYETRINGRPVDPVPFMGRK